MSTLPELLDDWYVRVDRAQRAHYLSADRYHRRWRMIGIPTVILSLLVGTSVFSTVRSHNDNTPLQIITGLCSVLAALLAGLQTFFNDAERYERHRRAGAKYGALGRELEVLRASPNAPDQKTVDRIRKELDSLALESPINNLAIYEIASQQAQRNEPLDAPRG